MKKRYQKLMMITFLGLIFFSYLIYSEQAINFHVVSEGKVYRSAQLSAGKLSDYIQKYGIKSILNLREIDDERWYREEIAVAKRFGGEGLCEEG